MRAHLSADVRHSAECRQRCAPGCDVVAFDTWLNAPVLQSDIAADEARDRRLKALLSGDLPT